MKTPVAWLHTVVADDGEPDQALSFSPDSFPLEGVAGYRKVSCQPLYAAPAQQAVDDAMVRRACLAYECEVDGHVFGPHYPESAMRAALTAALQPPTPKAKS